MNQKPASLFKLLIVLSIVVLLLGIQTAFATNPCADDLASCPKNGCAAAGSPNAIMNALKKKVISVANSKKVTFVTMEKLQALADSKVPQDHFLTQEERNLLKNLNVNGKRFSEGDAVRLSGYIVGNPHPNKGESVNCNLSGVENNDFHITLLETLEQEGENDINVEDTNLEYSGIVVEPIPQHRPASWTIPSIKQIQKDKKKVMVVGQLLYDSKHKVNSDPSHPKSNQPRRMSLWEIHPVIKLYVCEKTNGSCNEDKYSEWTEVK